MEDEYFDTPIYEAHLTNANKISFGDKLVPTEQVEAAVKYYELKSDVNKIKGIAGLWHQ